VEGVSLLGRNTQGVRLITLGEGERLMGMEPIADSGADTAGPDEGEDTTDAPMPDAAEDAGDA
jgi:DNA gyrase subunit A